jgi:hypothetical protein
LDHVALGIHRGRHYLLRRDRFRIMPYHTLPDGSTVHVTPGPDVRTPTGTEVSAVHCKQCKARTVHREVVLSDSQPSYYEPMLALQCKRCDKVRPWSPGPR